MLDLSEHARARAEGLLAEAEAAMKDDANA